MHCALDNSAKLVLAYFTEKLCFPSENYMSKDTFENNEVDTKNIRWILKKKCSKKATSDRQESRIQYGGGREVGRAFD